MDEKSLSRLLSREGTQARLAGVRAVYVEESKACTEWAEHHVEIITRAPDSGATANGQATVPDPSSLPGTQPAEGGLSAVDGPASARRRVHRHQPVCGSADPGLVGLCQGCVDHGRRDAAATVRSAKAGCW